MTPKTAVCYFFFFGGAIDFATDLAVDLAVTGGVFLADLVTEASAGLIRVSTISNASVVANICHRRLPVASMGVNSKVMALSFLSSSMNVRF